MNTKICLSGIAAIAMGLVLWIGGCVDPLRRDAEQELREQLIAANRSSLQAVAAGPVIQLQRPPSDVDKELTDTRRARLDEMSGPTAYDDQPLLLGQDLMGQVDQKAVNMTLQQAIHHAAQNNMDVQIAQIQPAISEAAITQAEADFDAVFFGTLNFQKQDTPQPNTSATLATFGAVKQDTRSLNTGIRKNLISGGQLAISTQMARNRRDPSFFSEPAGIFATPRSINTWYDSNILLSLNQPLLRNFGADVTRANILLATNARHEAVREFHRQLLDSILETESSYWGLVFIRQQLLIQQRLLERTIVDRDQLKQRENFDVSPVRLTEANSFVEQRRADVIRTRQLVRTASDALKRLINSPDLPLAGETMIQPLDKPADLPIQFSLLDAVSTALRHRPELQRLLYEINDATIRQRVADNLRLPLLDLAASMQFNSTSSRKSDDFGDAFNRLADGDFVDHTLTLNLEIPIGNRGPEAVFRQQQLARNRAVINYQRGARDVILEVKDSLRALHGSYQLIDAQRSARLAAADNLRALEEQEDAGVALTPEFLLDLKLDTQRRLAVAETEEIRALTEYNASIAALYRAMGTLLSRNGINFELDSD